MADEKNDGWQMPKPVFQSSPGALPKSLQKTISGYNLPRVQMPVRHDDDDDDILSVMQPSSDGNSETDDVVLPPPVVPAISSVPSANSEPADAAPAAANAAPAASTPEPPAAVSAPAEPLPANTVTPISSEKIKVSAAQTKAQKKGGAGKFIIIFLLIAAIAAGAVYAVMYYVSHKIGNGDPFQ
jgi:hypothetical protein